MYLQKKKRTDEWLFIVLYLNRVISSNKDRLQDSFLNVFPSLVAGLDSGAGKSDAGKLLLSSLYRKLMVNVVMVWLLILELFIS